MTPRVRIALSATFVVVLALLVRGLYLADYVSLLHTPEQDGSRMARRYDDTAMAILRGEGILFPKVWDPEKTGLASRPPGYGLFLALVYTTLGRSFPVVALAQDVLSSLAVLIAFGFAFRVYGLFAAFAAGILVALSPHIAATSNLVLADAISSLPLLAAFLIALPVVQRTVSARNEVLRLLMMGVLIGVAIWIRPNVILLGPFTAVFLFFLLGRNPRALLLSGLVAFTSLAVVSPITLRNWLIFDEFIPVSTNGGITLWQGVADAGGREYGARVWDKQVIAEEAERYNRPDYLNWWAEPDGITRDRDRYRRAMDVIQARPFWYARAMARRMAMMLLFTDGPPPLLHRGAVAAPPAREMPPLLPAPDVDANIDESRLAARAGWASFLRAPLRLIHEAWFLVPIFVAIGIGLSLRDSSSATVLWLVVPLYYLVFESPFLYEWRVAVPMQYFLLPFAAKAIAWAFGALRR